MFDEEELVGDFAGFAAFDELALEGEGGGVAEAAQVAHRCSRAAGCHTSSIDGQSVDRVEGLAYGFIHGGMRVDGMHHGFDGGLGFHGHDGFADHFVGDGADDVDA